MRRDISSRPFVPSRVRPALGLLGAAVLALAVAACGGGGTTTTVVVTQTSPTSGSTASSGGSKTSTTSTTATTGPTATTPAGPAACSTSQLSLSLGASDNGTSQARFPLVFKNTGSSACTLRGYPGVSYVAGEAGTQIGAPATRNASQPVTTVTLGAGGTAEAVLDVVTPGVFDPSTCKAVAVRGFRVYPPNQTAAAFVARPGNACSAEHLPSSALQITAVASHVQA